VCNFEARKKKSFSAHIAGVLRLIVKESSFENVKDGNSGDEHDAEKWLGERVGSPLTGNDQDTICRG
jgi:hypothetical protein